ncbi:Histidine kinase-, DNA gyrase B-, and HSP90-like ATPase [Lachnospiraceae bacterium]|nr:Histidine kinase-, DNA gyrase B-, and HSP90-like ATPase [Lachnospiraceae bacterium]
MKNKKNFEQPELSVEELSHALYEANKKLAETNKKLEESNKALDEANQRLEHNIRLKMEIYQNISHDLRSPITAIHNSIEYLDSLPVITEEDVRSVLPLMSSRTSALERMISEIFLITRLDTSDSLMQLQEIPCRDFLEDFFFMTEADSRFHDRCLMLDVPDDLNLIIKIDPDYMKRALDNLFNNALRHTEKGDKICLSAKEGGSKENLTVEIILSNNGLPLSDEDASHVFDRSWTGSSSRTPDSKSGIGLGLSIVKSIIEQHHGTVTAFSDAENEMSAAFKITLPAG